LRVEAGSSGDAVGAPRAAAQEGGASGAGLLETELERQAESLGLDSVDRFLEELDRQMAGDLPPLRVRDVISMVVRGEGAYTLPGFLRALGARLMREVLAGSGLLARLVILSLVAGLLKAIQSAFARSETAELAYGACYLVLIIMAMGGFLLAMEVCRGVIDNLTGFMQAMLPVMILLLAGVGAVSTAGLLNPVLVASVQFIAGFIRDVALPVVLCAACVDLVSRTFTRVKATALADLLRQGAVVVTGLLLSLFTGVVAVYGAAGSVVDGAAIKAAKFATATFIPFLGGFLADAVEVVISSSLVLKNVVGVVGALGVVAFTVFPLLKVLALVLVFRVAGALVQPLGAGELVGSLNSVGSSLVLMMVMACAVAVMFLITLAVVVMAATAAVMIR
jgi:stage III sporulation protein AE